MENKKITKREYFNTLRGIVENLDREDLVEFIDHEIELLNKKATSKKPTKIQVENENIKGLIIEGLENLDKPVTISELQESDENLANLSNQKISALLTQLIKDNKVVRVEDKRKAYFSLAD